MTRQRKEAVPQPVAQEVILPAPHFGVYVVDHRNQKILYANPTFLSMWNIEQAADPRIVALSSMQQYSLSPALDFPPQPDRNYAVEDNMILSDGRTLTRFYTQIRKTSGDYIGTLYLFRQLSNQEKLRIIRPNTPQSLIEQLVDIWKERGFATVEEFSQLVFQEESSLAEDEPLLQVKDAAGTLGPTDSADPLDMYSHEIGKIPLLTADQEILLGSIIQEAPRKIATAEREHNLKEVERLTRQAEAAKRRMIEANLRLVISIARKYANRGVALADLIQEGNMGLMTAVEKFDPKRGFRFSTYAYHWIRQGITRAVADQSRTIRIPIHAVEIIGKSEKARAMLRQRLGREPTDYELAAELHTTVEILADIRNADTTASLDAPVRDTNLPLAEAIEDKTQDPNKDLSDSSRKKGVERMLEKLNPRERRVMELRFGLSHSGTPMTLAEVGEELGVTRERARQIESAAMRKLRQQIQPNDKSDYFS